MPARAVDAMPARAVDAMHARPVIDIRHIHRIFESDAGLAHILHDVSLSVYPGEFVAITGPSGSGKSTLMNILGCLDTPTSGRYLLEGLNVAELTDDELAEVRALRIGFVFQSFNLLPRMTVLDNVTLPLAYTDVPRREREKRAVHALRSVGLPVDHYDHRTNELSGGQMQRVAIARALVNDPAIILADEPTGNLDSTTGRQVLDTFHALKRAGKTIVLITHDPGVAAEADRAVQIRDGRIYQGAYVPIEHTDRGAAVERGGRGVPDERGDQDVPDEHGGEHGDRDVPNKHCDRDVPDERGDRGSSLRPLTSPSRPLEGPSNPIGGPR